MLTRTKQIYFGFSYINQRDLKRVIQIAIFDYGEFIYKKRAYRSSDLLIVPEQAFAIFVEFAELSPKLFVSGMCCWKRCEMISSPIHRDRCPHAERVNANVHNRTRPKVRRRRPCAGNPYVYLTTRGTLMHKTPPRRAVLSVVACLAPRLDGKQHPRRSVVKPAAEIYLERKSICRPSVKAKRRQLRRRFPFALLERFMV